MPAATALPFRHHQPRRDSNVLDSRLHVINCSNRILTIARCESVLATCCESRYLGGVKGRGLGVGLIGRGLFALSAFAVIGSYGCGDSEDDSGSKGKGAEGGSSGTAGSGRGGADSGSGGISGGRGGTAGAATSGGSGPTAGEGGAGEGGNDTGGGQGGGAQGGTGGTGAATSEEVAASCLTPLMSALLPDNTFGWNTAALRIDVTTPTCALQPGMGVGSGGNALYFAHETNGSYSLWSDAPWSFTLDTGQSANNLPEDEELTVLPFLDDVRLRVVFTLSGESVTISSVEAQ